MVSDRLSHHYHTHTVTEHRAPTDESVRLLKELEDEARKKITETTVVQNTAFTCKIHKYYDLLNAADTYKIMYTLNGRKGTVEISLESFQMLTPEQTASFIRDKVAFDIANNMLYTAFMDEKHWSFFKTSSGTP